ncbi:COMM domain-containing protein 10, partial [Halocaridina rubra]
VFTEEEEEKLSSSVGVSLEEIKLVIQTVIHILQQAAYGMVRPALLGEHLLTAGLSQDRVSVFTDQWSANAKPIVDRLRQQSLSENQLVDIAWDLHLETASSVRAREARPIAHLQLNLRQGDSTVDTSTSEKVMMQFDQEQLYEFFDHLEQIQSHIDALR